MPTPGVPNDPVSIYAEPVRPAHEDLAHPHGNAGFPRLPPEREVGETWRRLPGRARSPRPPKVRRTADRQLS